MLKLVLSVTAGGKTQQFTIEGPVEIGRQQSGAEPLFRLIPASTEGRLRLAVADRGDATLSRCQLLIEPDKVGGQFRLTNLSDAHSFVLNFTHAELAPGECSGPLLVPELISLGAQRQVSVRVEAASTDGMASTGLAVRAPGEGQPTPLRGLELKNLTLEQLLGLIEENVSVIQTCPAKELYQKAAEVAHQVVRLDSVQILRWEPGQEQVVAQIGVSRSVLNRADAMAQVREGKTAFVSNEMLRSGKTSLELGIVAAAPLVNRNREVIGALYGERETGHDNHDLAVTKLEALLLQQLARELSLALDRLRAEEEERGEMTRLTMYMDPEQAQAVMTDSSWRTGRTVPVTILFSDIAGFTKITAGPDSMTALQWSADVLNMLTGCVRKQKGTLIDYTGDGLCALWGAPIPQADRARLACEAALDMIHGLECINQTWKDRLGHETRLRIGLNSGQATGGNIGSMAFNKFGVHGKTVNVGKRIETAAKLFKCPILLSHSTHQMLDVSTLTLRKLARIEVEGDDVEQFDVYELCPDRTPGDGRDWVRWRQVYEMALMNFEDGIKTLNVERVRKAGYEIGQWRQANVWDRPALMLLRRIVNASAEDDLKGQSWVLKVTKG